jgi:AmiR/NasT family two-component response regulator
MTMDKKRLSVDDQKRIEDAIEMLVGVVDDIYGEGSDVEVLIGLVVSASIEKGMAENDFFDAVHTAYDDAEKLDALFEELTEDDGAEERVWS